MKVDPSLNQIFQQLGGIQEFFTHSPDRILCGFALSIATMPLIHDPMRFNFQVIQVIEYPQILNCSLHGQFKAFVVRQEL